MQLLLLGTGGYHPSEARHTACLMLPEVGVVLDAGTAMFRVREALATDTLDIFLTHAHLDHVVGLTYLLNMTRTGQLKRVNVYGEEAKLAAVTTHLFSELIFPVIPPFEVRPLGDESLPLDRGGRLTHFPLAHPGGSVGYRLDWPGHSVAYVTDTTASTDAAYIEQIRGVDLLVHEAYFNDDRTSHAELTGHSCVSQVARVAAAAEARRLVLVHVDPLADPSDPLDLSSARSIFPAIELGTDRLAVEF